MPPQGAGEPLSDAEIRVLREWIDRGHFGDAGEAANSTDRPFSPAEAPADHGQTARLLGFPEAGRRGRFRSRARPIAFARPSIPSFSPSWNRKV